MQILYEKFRSVSFKPYSFDTSKNRSVRNECDDRDRGDDEECKTTLGTGVLIAFVYLWKIGPRERSVSYRKKQQRKYSRSNNDCCFNFLG